MANLKAHTDRLFNRIHRTGEELKNDLPNLIQRAIDAEVWKDATNPATGKPFDNAGEWLIANYPLGPGVGNGRFAIDYDDCIRLCASRPAVKDMLVKHRPKGKVGGDRQSSKAKQTMVDNVNNGAKRKTGNTRLYIEERLCRDYKDIWQDYLNGKYPSARQAGIAAGFIKDTHDPLVRMKANWNKATKAQRRAFLKWVEEQ
jgi:hypothetical protein